MDFSSELADPELGYCGFTVLRTSYRRADGAPVPSVRRYAAAGCVHPGTPETLRLLPEEDRNEEYIEVYTDFPLCLGENGGGTEYTAPDRILWNGEAWRAVTVRNWSNFGYRQALAVRTRE